jgi:hypothetical protein
MSASSGTSDAIQRKHISIKFQVGPVQEHGPNGAQIEEIIEILLQRLMGLQTGPFPCVENNQAIYGLMQAKFALEKRTATRVEQGVEGYSKAHV